MDEEQSQMEQAWADSQLAGVNSAFLDQVYDQYLQDPGSVDPSWRHYFDELVGGGAASEPHHEAIKQAFIDLTQKPQASRQAPTQVDGRKHSQVMDLINAYRRSGHRISQTDPLELKDVTYLRELELSFYGLSPEDLNQKFDIDDFKYAQADTLAQIIEELKRVYCGTCGIEYMHITDTHEKLWLRQRIESLSSFSAELPTDEAKQVLRCLVAADGLEKYLATQYAGQKRFSLEGGDSLIPLLHTLIQHSGQHQVYEVVLGMAHRGRLNVLTNIVGKSPEVLFEEFEGKHDEGLISGDVKYHMGFSSDIETQGGNVHLSLSFNPSHLEIVGPVVEGSVRARQLRRGSNRQQVMAIQIHGDAAFAGQGVVMETLNMSQTRGFRTGGSVHIVLNNQVGFTISKEIDARSTHYCSDVAKMIEAPVFHVNGNDPERVAKVAQLAFDYRMTFNKDVVIDLVCYRRRGHNESDEPFGTQPLMYQKIAKMPTPREIYADCLVARGALDQAEVDAMNKDYRTALDARQCIPNLQTDGDSSEYIVDWTPYKDCTWDVACSTQVPKKTLKALGQQLDQIPADFTPQRQVAKLLEQRAKMTSGELAVNWGYAELMAYATLLKSGHRVRLSGEDSGRGTFAHRHAVLHDQKDGSTYIPLNHLCDDQSEFLIIDSLLSEEAVLAFEYGFSSSDPNTLVIWEAQFGDFANTAQVVFDQFISSAEEKWGRLCGLVLYLPHGYEGMGPEHSSARLERQLQLCANDNMQVCVPTTPAQQFHLLRRQMLRPFKKPLIVMTPKSLLRHPKAVSTLDQLAKGAFMTVIDEVASVKKSQVKRVLCCSGKIYYELVEAREKAKIDHIAILRIEQLYPFPDADLLAILDGYPKLEAFVWTQEEPKNQGAWLAIQNKLSEILPQHIELSYVGRVRSASPAVGYPSLHIAQRDQLVKEALNI